MYTFIQIINHKNVKYGQVIRAHCQRRNSILVAVARDGLVKAVRSIAFGWCAATGGGRRRRPVLNGGPEYSAAGVGARRDGWWRSAANESELTKCVCVCVCARV